MTQKKIYIAKIKGFPSKTLHPIPNQKCLMFNSSFSKFLTKNHLPHPILNTQQKRKWNDDNDDDYKFWNKKTGKK